MFLNLRALQQIHAKFKGTPFICDSETDGLQVIGPCSRDKAWIVGLLPSGYTNVLYIDCGHPEWEDMKHELEGMRLVFHNGRFDIHAMNAKPRVTWLDTMSAAYHLNTAGKKSLDDLFPGEKLPTLPELKGPKGEQNSIHLLRYGLNSWDPRLLAYLDDDLLKTDRLHRLAVEWDRYHDLDERVEQVVQRMEDRGVVVIQEQVAELRRILGPMVDEQVETLVGHGFNGNPNSSDQLLAFLSERAGYVRTCEKWRDEVLTPEFKAFVTKPEFKWKLNDWGTLKPSTDGKKVVQPLADNGDPFALALLEYRSYVKKYRDFALKLSGGPVHGQIRTLMTKTGRFSHAEPNLGQIPKQNKTPREIELGLALKFRACFTGQSGYMSGADFGQVEMRVAAALSGDENLLAAFGPGMDFHTATACQVFGGTPETLRKEQRFAVKQINFGILNGMKEQRLALAIGCNVYKARQFRSAYLARFQGLADWMEEVTADARQQRVVHGLDGSCLVYGPDEWINNAVSMKVQGGSAVAMKHALVACEDAGLKPVLSVHDEIICDVKDRGEECAEVMREAANSFMPELFSDIDFVAEGGQGTTWADVDTPLK
jgi:DNA polymerase I-like protein with 3'-5' exonuclease and polymerase domains